MEANVPGVMLAATKRQLEEGPLLRGLGAFDAPAHQDVEARWAPGYRSTAAD